jgi:hypothetical protein
LVKKIVFLIAIATMLAVALVAWHLRQAANGLNVAPSAAQEIEKAKHR